MSKPKVLLKHGKSKKNREPVLETADDFQAAGVDFEEAAGKWRAGDAFKSSRMFGRAIEVYNQGLSKFPQSFDLAYNKARVQLEIVTHPLLIKTLEVPVLGLLEEALISHRYAIQLNSENADLLFNTSQVLTAIAEEYAKDNTRPDQDALQPLQDALEFQSRCLGLQELEYEEAQAQQQSLMQQATSEQADNTTDKDDRENMDQPPPTNVPEDQWFSVVEPVTQDTLIDTILAQLGTLTTLCSILSSSTVSVPGSSLAWIEEYSSKLVNVKLPAYARDTSPERLQEIALAKAIFVSATLDALFRSSQIDAPTYKRERDAAFSISELNIQNSFDVLLANAQSLISFNSALAEISTNAETFSSYASTRWNALSSAMSSLSTASKIPNTPSEDIAKTHLLRGDCSLLQCQLSLPPLSFQTAITNRTQVLKNAEIFYRNASKLASDDESKIIASMKSAIALALSEGRDVVPAATATIGKQRGTEWMQAQLSEMVDDGLISSDGH